MKKVNRMRWSKIKSQFDMLKAAAINIIIEESVDKAMGYHETHMERDMFGNVAFSHAASHPRKTRAEEILERIKQLQEKEKKAVERENYLLAKELKSKIDILINMYRKL